MEPCSRPLKWIILMALLSCCHSSALQRNPQSGEASDVFLGVPGTSHTISGYDTEAGLDAVCWVTANAQTIRISDNEFNFSKADGNLTLLDNNLANNFYVFSDPAITLLPQCPKGINLHGYTPSDIRQIQGEMTLQTKKSVDFNIKATIDMSGVEGMQLFSDKFRYTTLQVQIILCLTSVVAFCSPYVHEHADARMDQLGMSGMQVETGDLHGGTHVHAYGVFLPVDLSNAGGNTSAMKTDIDVMVPVLVTAPGDFFAIGETTELSQLAISCYCLLHASCLYYYPVCV